MRLAAILVLFLSVGSVSTLARPPFPEEHLKTLQAAVEGGGYGVTLLRRPAGATQEQWVVLLSEVHAKSQQSSEQGRQVLSTFPGSIGIESVVELDQYAGGYALKHFAMPLILGIAGVAGLKQGSSAYDALEIGKSRGQQVLFLEKGHVPDLLEHLTILHIDTSVGYTVITASVRAGAGGVWLVKNIYTEGVFQTGTQLLKSGGQLPAKVLRFFADPFVQGARGLRSLCSRSVLDSLRRGPGIAIPQFQLQMPSYEGTRKTVLGAMGLNVLVILALSVHSASSDTHHWGLIENRNETMVKNLVDHLDNPENPKSALVVFGALHRPGVIKQLEAQGFEVVPFTHR